jgi:hypothetical protein
MSFFLINGSKPSNHLHYKSIWLLLTLTIEHVDLKASGWEGKEKELILEILKGAHVVLDDGGRSYKDWSQTKQLKDHCIKRISSHESNRKAQYAIRGAVLKEFLFSQRLTTEKDRTERNMTNSKATWFQLERHPIKLGYYLLHFLSWINYRITGLNQGPFGESAYTEKINPLILKLKK